MGKFLCRFRSKSAQTSTNHFDNDSLSLAEEKEKKRNRTQNSERDAVDGSWFNRLAGLAYHHHLQKGRQLTTADASSDDYGCVCVSANYGTRTVPEVSAPNHDTSR